MKQHRNKVSRAAALARVLLATALGVSLQLGAAPVAQAQSVSTQVWVLPTGGTRVLWSYQVQASPESAQITRRADNPINLEDGSLASYTAALKMPGGHLLLGDGAGRGAVRFDARGDEVESLSPPGQWVSSPGLSVVSLLDDNTPGELLMGDNSVGRAHVYDTVEGRYIWSTPLGLSNASARVAATAVLPGERFALAVNWPAAELSGLLIFDRDDRNTPALTLLSAEHPDRSDSRVVPELSLLRDMMALPSGELLVATSSAILRLSAEGEVMWQAPLADAGVGGEFLALSFLSERFAIVSTYQPGLWTSPHPNHRLLVYDTAGDTTPLSVSSPLDGAPLAIELATGHGATRTFGYEAARGDATLSDLSALAVYDDLTLASDAVPPGAPLGLSLGVRNEAEAATFVRAFELLAAPGTCASTEGWSAERWQEEVRLWMYLEPTLQPQQELLLSGEANTAPLFIGPWCAQMVAENVRGQARLIGSAAPFSITAGEDADTIEVESLGRFEPGQADPGPDPEAPPLTPNTEGGGCSSGPGAPSHPGGFAMAALAILIGQRRRRN
ncbi:hypothetical protein FRC98_01645 [Lujinxingia vulgaris]|uniref:PQQ-binding-like beta-propeller repeat protein n=1 Tax=Lujinxingia vulgaris TaxID=2600176 RepID=A0A5C6XF68_9DELT|nr:MYXO-CTERM sorting domain-containing protein [Lujinxingia vulgaris]TXD39133.1 hypothetical protein FRC98_01645 [Lujinxingia vulgaris]